MMINFKNIANGSVFCFEDYPLYFLKTKDESGGYGAVILANGRYFTEKSLIRKFGDKIFFVAKTIDDVFFEDDL